MSLNRILTVIVLLLAAIAAYLYFDKSPATVAEAETPSKGDARPIVTVNVPTLSAAAKIGETAFNAICAACHGVNAAGNEGKGPPLIHKIYEPSHHGDMSFFLAVQNGVRAHHWPFGDMAPVTGLTEGDVKNIIIYIREVQLANGID